MQTTKIRLENGEEREMLELDIQLRKDGIVKYKADGLIIDTKLMEPGEPYMFRLADEYIMAAKSEKGHVDLYSVFESDDDEEAE